MAKDKKKENSGEKLRPPIITVLGHVDHGKTTLLDAIRKTNEVRKEAGGITQSIGASVVKTKDGQEITFIDTPGHAAFEKMRSRGANAADIAILVVAADDGVKPQTKEAIKHIKKAKIPFIVALTKVDLDTANEESSKAQLEKEEVYFEGRGGDVPIVSVSGKEGTGIDDLLEMIVLVSEVNEIKGDPKGKLKAVVIETGIDNRGPVVSVVVKNGTLSVRDEIVSVDKKGKVKGLFDHYGKAIKSAGPGKPALILGFSELPPVGARVFHEGEGEVVEAEKDVKTKKDEGEINLVIKALNQGSLEAVLANLPEEILVVSSGIGEVNESDVFDAKASNATIYSFEATASSSVRKLAEAEGVEINSYDIIYKLLEDVEERLEGTKVKILGEAKIVKKFPYNKKQVAGSKITKGRINKSDTVLVKRDDKELGEVRITSMRKQKDEISEAKVGEECGILFVPQLDFQEGDMLVSVNKTK